MSPASQAVSGSIPCVRRTRRSRSFSTVRGCALSVSIPRCFFTSRENRLPWARDEPRKRSSTSDLVMPASQASYMSRANALSSDVPSLGSAGISFSSARAPQNLTIPRQQPVSSSLLRNTLEEDQSFSAENCPRGCAWRGARAGGLCPSRVVLGARPPRGVPPGRRGQRRPQRLLEFFEGQDDFVALHPCEEGIPAVVLTYSGSS